MSGVGPTAPDEESGSPDHPAGPRGNSGTDTPSGGGRIGLSSASGPRPSLDVPPSSSQDPTQTRGSRTASGHPPSILPPEKVFPIQIGSELFRLSGASISSDGTPQCQVSMLQNSGLTQYPAPSYFTQFFEEQIRQNEETGGVRTLYIDRDPGTFRDVVRHLQGLYPSSQAYPGTVLTALQVTT